MEEIDLHINRDSNEPIYRQIAEYLRTQIALGALSAGQRLPTVRKLADQLSVSPLTVFDAYRHLRKLKLVEATVGRGTSVASAITRTEGVQFLKHVPTRRTDTLFEVVAAQSGVRSMATGVADVGFFPADELIAEIDELRSQRDWAFFYAPGPGAYAFLDAISGVIGAHTPLASADQLVATFGGRHGLRMVASEFIDPGSIILVEGYQALGHTGVWSSANVGHEIVPRVEGRPNLEALERAKGAKALYVAPTGCSATGRVMCLEDRMNLLEIARRKDWLVIEDCSHALIHYGSVPESLVSLDDTVIQIGTFSSCVAPGLRLGYIMANCEARRRLVQRIEFEDATGPLFLQLAFAKFVKRGRLRAHLQRVQPKYQSRRDATLSALKRNMDGLALWDLPLAGLSIGLKLEHKVDQIALFEACLEKGFAFCPGKNIAHSTEADRFIRVSFGLQPQESISHAVETLANLLRVAR